MTTPEQDFPEPYARVLKGTSDNTTLHPYYTLLQEGASTITVSWDRPGALDVFLAPEQNQALRRNVARIPAGSGRRSVMVPNVGVDQGESYYFGCRLPGGDFAMPEDRATVTVVTIPLRD